MATFTALPYENIGMASALSNTVWPTWVNSTGTYTGLATTTVTATSSNYFTAAQVWPTWVESSAVTTNGANTSLNPAYTYIGAVWSNWYDESRLTAEQRAALREAQAKARREQEEQLRKAEEARKAQEEKRKQAAARAKELLLCLLDEAQEKQYAEKGTFELRTDKARYRIKPGDRVEELNPEGIVVARFCIHPAEYGMPREDWAIAQKLMLETDEETFLRTANRSAA